jgi:hypothetical protein
MVLEGYVTLEELARRLGLKSTGGLRTQIQRGVLKASRAGHNWFVEEAEALRYETDHAGKKGRPPKAAADPEGGG